MSTRTNVIVHHESFAFQNRANHFIEACVYKHELKYRLSRMLVRGEINHLNEWDTAIKRAMIVCKTAGYSVENNFRCIYLADEHGIYKDWLFSLLAQKLVLLNANPALQSTARLQITLLSSL